MSVDSFKMFVRKNPNLIKYVNNNEMTWQKFYEMYDLYGEDKSIWDKYVKEEEKPTINTKHNNKNSFNEVINMVKNMDVDKVQEGITSLQKALSLFGDLVVSKNNPTSSNNNYTPRPVYKRFED
jgi:hypothetical protein